jgi:hypothetical protein
LYPGVVGAEIKPFVASYVPPLAVNGAGVDLSVGVVRPAVGRFAAPYVIPLAAYGAGVDLSVGVERGVITLSRDCQKSITRSRRAACSGRFSLPRLRVRHTGVSIEKLVRVLSNVSDREFGFIARKKNVFVLSNVSDRCVTKPPPGGQIWRSGAS